MCPENTPPPLPPAFSPAPPPPPPSSPERVLTVVDKLKQRVSMFSSQGWRLVVTDRRLIFVIHTKNNVDYARQAPDLSLAENPQNFAIPLSEVKKLETYQAGFDSGDPDALDVITSGKTLEFSISNYYKVQKQLKDVLGGLVS